MADNKQARETQSRHTAAPWLVTIDPSYPNEFAIDAMIDGALYHIALVHIVPGQDEVTQANAALIAAAPELRAELEVAADIFREIAKECAHCNYGNGATGKASDGESACEECAEVRLAERRARCLVSKSGHAAAQRAMNASEARTSVLETIGRLQAIAALGQTRSQQETARKLATRLFAVLPLIDAVESTEAPAPHAEPTQPGIDAPTSEWFVYYRLTVAHQRREIARLRQIENAAMRVSSSRRGKIVTDQAPLDALDNALVAP